MNRMDGSGVTGVQHSAGKVQECAEMQAAASCKAAHNRDMSGLDQSAHSGLTQHSHVGRVQVRMDCTR